MSSLFSKMRNLCMVMIILPILMFLISAPARSDQSMVLNVPTINSDISTPYTCSIGSKTVTTKYGDSVTTTTTATSFATGAIAIGAHGKTTTLVGYSGIITGVPTIKLGQSTLSLNGFIGAGETSISGTTTYGVGIYPNFSIGSLDAGVGVFWDTKANAAEGMFTLSLSIN